jgi:hypothetical protein
MSGANLGQSDIPPRGQIKDDVLADIGQPFARRWLISGSPRFFSAPHEYDAYCANIAAAGNTGALSQWRH